MRQVGVTYIDNSNANAACSRIMLASYSVILANFENVPWKTCCHLTYFLFIFAEVYL